MAIAPSKFGQLVEKHWDSDDTLVRALREAALVRGEAADEDLRATFRRARDEHAALAAGQQQFNSPNERVRVFLEPFLSEKGRKWARPLDSLRYRRMMSSFLRRTRR